MASRCLFIAALAGSVLAGCAAQPRDESARLQSAANVRVAYVQPENFSDVGEGRFTPERQRAGYLEEIRRHIVRGAARLLADKQTLDITITDVDMAGGFEPWQRASSDLRIIRDIYPPRIELRFRLAGGDGTTLKEGSRTLRDPAFLMSSGLPGYEPLKYEKAMIDRWLERELGAPKT